VERPRTHTIPRFYLENFFPGFVYRRGEKSPRFTRKARNLAVRIGYYGKPDDALIPLDKMNSVIESESALVLRRIVGDVTTMSRIDWITLSYFFANMAIRTPAYHDVMLRDYQHMVSEVSKMAEDMMRVYEDAKAKGEDLSIFNTPLGDDEKRFRLDDVKNELKEMEAEGGQVKVAEGVYYQMKVIAECIQKMSLHILTALGGAFFITADRPLTLFSLLSGSTLGAGWGNSDAMAVMPLDPKRCLVLAYRGNPAVYTKDISTDDVRFWNVEMMKYAQNEVYSRYPLRVDLCDQ